MNIIEKAHISDIIHTQIQDNFIDQSGGSLIPEEVFDGVMPKDEVDKIFSSYIDDALDFAFCTLRCTCYGNNSYQKK